MSAPASPNPDDDLDCIQTARGMRKGLLAFGRYRLVSLLGRGPTGAVWLAQDESLQVSVALKFLAGGVLGDPGALDKLRRETRHRLALTHPHIVRIFNLEESAGTIAVVMEYVEGINLGVLRAAKPERVFEFAEVSAWLQQLCGTLSYAHEQAHFIHGNLKPSNILLTHKSEIKLADFGVGPSNGESISGTLAYMSPQQLMGHPPVVTDDVYALGATLYELLTSKPPFYTGSIERQIQRVIPPSVELRRTELGISGKDEVPAAWEQAIAACLDKDAKRRPQTVSELWQRLNWEPESAPPPAVPVPAPTANQPARPPYRAPISPRHWRVSHFKTLVVAVILCVGAAVAWWFGLEVPMRVKAAYQTKKQSDSEAAQKLETDRLFEEAGMQKAEQAEAARAAKEKADADQQARQIAVQAEAKFKDLSKSFSNPKIGDTSVFDIGNGVKMTLCYIPPGNFTMGMPASEASRSDNERQVPVQISKGYWLAKTECTQAQWRVVMGTEPSRFSGDSLPVEKVSWKDVQAFMSNLNDRNLQPAGWKWSLPTEAQWEYACRAGTTQTYARELELMAWINENSAGKTHPVGKRAANRWGLQDMHGNVSEWCSDFRGAKLPTGTDPAGPLYDSFAEYGATSHVIRGSTFEHKINHLASYIFRSSMSTAIRSNYTGFRVAVVPETETPVEIERTAKEKANAEEKLRQIAGSKAAAYVTQKSPFENSLGMKFVPVPGTKVLMCVHETRNADYAAYAAAQGGVDQQWRGEAGGGKEQHPVVNVSYDDAEGFCRWLSAKEGQTYSLPTDAEWSAAVGLANETGVTPEEKSKNGKNAKDVFPWGSYYPPKPEDGNYGGDVADGFKGMAPAMSFRANELGLYDLGGNAWEWCQDWFDESKTRRVLRGGSFYGYFSRGYLLSSTRNCILPVGRTNLYGFRVVVVAGALNLTARQVPTSPVKPPQVEASDEAKPSPSSPKRVVPVESVPELVKKLGGTYSSGSGGARIDLVRANLTTADLLQIGTAKHLKDFYWNGGTGLTDGGMAAFAGMENLANLLLWHVGSITDAGLKNLEGCKKLEVLNIGANGGGITGAGFESLSMCESLRVLTLNHLVNVEGRNLRFLINLKHLEHLRLSMCKGITDTDLDWVSQMPKLEKLHLGNTSVTDAGLLKLAGMSSLKELTVTPPVTQTGVNALTKTCPGLVVNFEDSLVRQQRQ